MLGYRWTIQIQDRQVNEVMKMLATRTKKINLVAETFSFELIGSSSQVSQFVVVVVVDGGGRSYSMHPKVTQRRNLPTP